MARTAKEATKEVVKKETTIFWSDIHSNIFNQRKNKDRSYNKKGSNKKNRNNQKSRNNKENREKSKQ